MSARILTLTLALAVPSALGACDDDGGDEVEVTYTGSFVNGFDQSPLAGVEVCIVAPSGIPCVQTAADGRYTIALPADTEVEVEVQKEGFIPVRSNFVTRTRDAEISAEMFQPAAVEAAFALAGATYDDTLGGLLVRVYDPARGQTVGLAGVSVDIEPSDGEGPYYLDGLTFSASATATTPGGNALFALLEDKTYKIRLESDTHDCPGTFLWHAPDGRVDAIVKPGFATYIYADCTPK